MNDHNTPQADIGLIGLGVMGENLALNIESRGFRVAVYNRTPEKTRAFMAGRAAEKPRVSPFSFSEWQLLMEFVFPWYRPYFEFAVQTGLRPSEQVALKWSAIDADFVHVELSRVRNCD